MDKEEIYTHTHARMHAHAHTHTHKGMCEDEIVTFTTTWMDLGGVYAKSGRQKQIPYDFTYMWSLKTQTIQTHKNRTRPTNTENTLGVAKKERRGGLGKMGEAERRGTVFHYGMDVMGMR